MVSKFGFVEIDGIPIDIEKLPLENLERYSQIKSEERKKLIDMQDKLLIDLINKDVKN